MHRQQESGRRIRKEGGSEGGGARIEMDRGEAGYIDILGKRQVTLIWADDPVRRHRRRGWGGCRGRRGMPPPDGHQAAGKEGGAGEV